MDYGVRHRVGQSGRGTNRGVGGCADREQQMRINREWLIELVALEICGVIEPCERCQLNAAQFINSGNRRSLDTFLAAVDEALNDLDRGSEQ